MVNRNLDEKLFRLNSVSGWERKEMREHFLKYSRECFGCKECEYKHHIIELYELMCIDSNHKHNLRKGEIYTKAEEFVNYHFIKDKK